MRKKPNRLDHRPTPRDVAGFARLFASATALWIGGTLVLGAGIVLGVLLKETLRR